MTATDSRRAGVLLHVTSLPSGTLGEEAFGFVDFLADAGCSVWQVLPLVPTHDDDGSPYNAPSAMAGNPDLIVDFSGVTFAGSAALSGFVNLQRACRQHGGRIVLCNLEPTVTEAFRISRLESFFLFARDLPAAFEALEARSAGTPRGD